MNGALTGVKVLDFSTLLPGPMATLFLAEAGAEVIKIERPAGEDMRAYLPRWGQDSVNFALLNRGKKSLALDLKNPDQRDRLRPLIAETDVVVEQFRPGVMDRLGLGYEALREIKPDIIYCAITGYGQTGPKRDTAGHDLNYIGDTGLLALGYGDPSRPTLPPALIADIAGGAYPAVVNILLALRQRDRSGSGAYLDISMTDGLFPFLYWALGGGQVSGRWPGNGDALVNGGSPRYQIYPTSDGQLLAAAPLEDKFWASFTELIGLEPALRSDDADPQTVIRRVAELVKARPAEHWRPLLAEADCCCSIVQTVEQALADEHFRARGLFNAAVHNGAGASVSALPVPIAAALRGAPEPAAPALGRHNDELL